MKLCAAGGAITTELRSASEGGQLSSGVFERLRSAPAPIRDAFVQHEIAERFEQAVAQGDAAAAQTLLALEQQNVGSANPERASALDQLHRRLALAALRDQLAQLPKAADQDLDSFEPESFLDPANLRLLREDTTRPEAVKIVAERFQEAIDLRLSRRAGWLLQLEKVITDQVDPERQKNADTLRQQLEVETRERRDSIKQRLLAQGMANPDAEQGAMQSVKDLAASYLATLPEGDPGREEISKLVTDIERHLKEWEAQTYEEQGKDAFKRLEESSIASARDLLERARKGYVDIGNAPKQQEVEGLVTQLTEIEQQPAICRQGRKTFKGSSNASKACLTPMYRQPN